MDCYDTFARVCHKRGVRLGNNGSNQKKKMDFSKVEFLTYEEGVCVQSMHIGTYDEEPLTIKKMDSLIKEQGYEPDMKTGRYHHEIYLSAPRRCAPEKLKTVIRHPIRKSFVSCTVGFE